MRWSFLTRYVVTKPGPLASGAEPGPEVVKRWFSDGPAGDACDLDELLDDTLPGGPGALDDLTRGQVMRVRYHLLSLLGFEPHEELCDLLYRTSRPAELEALLDRDFTNLDGSVLRVSRAARDAFQVRWRGSDGRTRRGRLVRGTHW